MSSQTGYWSSGTFRLFLRRPSSAVPISMAQSKRQTQWNLNAISHSLVRPTDRMKNTNFDFSFSRPEGFHRVSCREFASNSALVAALLQLSCALKIDAPREERYRANEAHSKALEAYNLGRDSRFILATLALNLAAATSSSILIRLSILFWFALVWSGLVWLPSFPT